MNPTHPITDDLGTLVMTPGVREYVVRAGLNPNTLLARHKKGDWGDLDAEDWEINNRSTEDGERILSSYNMGDGTVIWIITERRIAPGRRYATTLLLPEEY